MGRRGKKYRGAAGNVNRLKRYELDEAIDVVKKSAYAKFDETVDVAINLGIDPKHADQMVRGAVALPHGTGKTVRVLAFAKGDKEKEAREAGADVVGAEDLVAKVQEGWLEFDRVVATPDMMGQVGRLGRVLGPRGLMPNPKVGTVTPDIGKAVRALKAGQVQFKVEKAGIVHVPVGKVSFDAARLRENFLAFFEAIQRARPPAAKGTFVKAVTLSSTMGPGVKVDVNYLQAQQK